MQNQPPLFQQNNPATASDPLAFSKGLTPTGQILESTNQCSKWIRSSLSLSLPFIPLHDPETALPAAQPPSGVRPCRATCLAQWLSSRRAEIKADVAKAEEVVHGVWREVLISFFPPSVLREELYNFTLIVEQDSSN